MFATVPLYFWEVIAGLITLGIVYFGAKYGLVSFVEKVVAEGKSALIMLRTLPIGDSKREVIGEVEGLVLFLDEALKDGVITAGELKGLVRQAGILKDAIERLGGGK